MTDNSRQAFYNSNDKPDAIALREQFKTIYKKEMPDQWCFDTYDDGMDEGPKFVCDYLEDSFYDFTLGYRLGQSQAVPDGWVLVPKEPTGPMIMYGIHAYERNDDLPNIGLGPKCIGVYRAMITAAQKEGM